MSEPDVLRVLAGDCRVRADGVPRCGEMVVLSKPDNTVLVHDVDGYQPVAWLTRADSVSYTGDDGAASPSPLSPVIDPCWSNCGPRTASVDIPARGLASPSATVSTARPLVRARGRVSCPGCGSEYGLPDGASVLDEP